MLNEFICWLIGHAPQARCRFTDDGHMEAYYECKRCQKELE